MRQHVEFSSLEAEALEQLMSLSGQKGGVVLRLFCSVWCVKFA